MTGKQFLEIFFSAILWAGWFQILITILLQPISLREYIAVVLGITFILTVLGWIFPIAT